MATCPVELTNCPIPSHHINEPNLANFSITRETLGKLLQGDNIEESSFQHDSSGHGGILLQQVASALETNLDKGIPGDASDLHRRHKAFGRNIEDYYDPHQPCVSRKGLICSLSLEAYYNDPTVILLLCCASLSLVIGIKRNGPEEGFRDGAILFLAIFMVVSFGSTCKFIKARIIRMTNKYSRRTKSTVRVMRGGILQHVPATQIVVGDVLCLELGHHAPADGLLIIHDHHHWGLNVTKSNSIIFCGTKVEGDCQMLVMSVGRNTERGRLMSSISSSTNTSHDNGKSGLNAAIEKINSWLERIWLSLSLLILVVQLVRCFGWEAKYCDEEHEPDPKGFKGTVEEIMNETAKLMLLKKRQGGRSNYKATNGLVAMLCILILALRDGLPFGIFILLAFASKKIKSFNQLVMVQNVQACATLGLVTTICASPMGDLTLDHSKMASLWIGVDGTLKEVNQLVEAVERCPEVLDALREGICMNSCGVEEKEDVFLWWAKEALGFDSEKINQSRTILCRKNSDRNMDCFGLSVISRKEDNSSLHVHWKGKLDVVLSMCSHCYDDAIDGTVEGLDDKKRAALNEVMATISSDSLDCFALAYKKIVLEEKEENSTLELEKGTLRQETFKHIELQSMIFVGLVVLKKPYSPEVRKAVEHCRERGVKIRLAATSGDMLMARLIARLMANHCGRLNLEDSICMDDAVIEASEFRNSSKEDRQSMVDKILVMVNCTPMDKLVFVQCLREKGEVVAATATSIRDSPLLAEADVGLSIGPELGKVNADMVMSDLNLVTICAAFEFGRCVCSSILNFLQLQLTFNAVAFSVSFGVVLVTSREVPLSAFQLLWVNLVMLVLGALALVTSMLGRAGGSPHSKRRFSPSPILMITNNVWRNMAIQSVYQVTVLLTIYLKGKAMFHVDRPVLKAMVFNSYVLCMVFALINARKVQDNKRDRYLGWWFVAILGCMLILQLGVAEITAALGWAGKLSLVHWCICIGVGSVSFLVDRFSRQLGVDREK